jgi:hypothetical protein
MTNNQYFSRAVRCTLKIPSATPALDGGPRWSCLHCCCVCIVVTPMVRLWMAGPSRRCAFGDERRQGVASENSQPHDSESRGRCPHTRETCSSCSWMRGPGWNGRRLASPKPKRGKCDACRHLGCFVCCDVACQLSPHRSVCRAAVCCVALARAPAVLALFIFAPGNTF